MDNYIFPNKTDLVNYLFDKLDDPSPIKIQKTLYFLFAYYGAMMDMVYELVKDYNRDFDITAD